MNQSFERSSYTRVDYERMKDLEDYAKRLGYVLYSTQTEETLEDYPRLTMTFQQGFALPFKEEDAIASGSFTFTPTAEMLRGNVEEIFTDTVTNAVPDGIEHVGSLVDITRPRPVHMPQRRGFQAFGEIK